MTQQRPLKTRMLRFAVITLLVALAVPSATTQAQAVADTFMVTLMTKTPVNPYYQYGDTLTYAIDGIEARILTLQRLKTYVFIVGAMPIGHYFTISRVPIGESRRLYDSGVTGQGATAGRTLIFTPPKGSPDTLYYSDGSVRYATGLIVLVDSLTSGVEQEHADNRSLAAAHHAMVAPNPVAGAGRIRYSAFSSGAHTVELIDVWGRVVFRAETSVDAPGRTELPIDVAFLPNGAYAFRVKDEQHELVGSGLLHVLH